MFALRDTDSPHDRCGTQQLLLSELPASPAEPPLAKKTHCRESRAQAHQRQK